jgi:hypothetical protein
MSILLGLLLAAAPDPLEPSLACLQKGDAQLSLEWEQSGCFHRKKGFLRVSIDGPVARLQVTKDDGQQNVKVSVAAARALIQDFASAATRAEKFSMCMSTEQWHATLRWQCGGQAELDATFTTSSCGRDYTRARGLIELAEGAK